MERNKDASDLFVDTPAAHELKEAVERGITPLKELIEVIADGYFKGLMGNDVVNKYLEIGQYQSVLNPGDVENDRELMLTLLILALTTARSQSVTPRNRESLLTGPVRWLMSDLHLLYRTTLTPHDRQEVLGQACEHLDQCMGWAYSSLPRTDKDVLRETRAERKRKRKEKKRRKLGI